jgi:hypothetical protein
MIRIMAEIFLVIFIVFLVRVFLQRNLPRVGGKIGPRQKMTGPESIPEGFSGVYARSMRLSVASAEAAKFSSAKAFLRQGTREIPALMRIYCVTDCKTEIEIPAKSPDYERIAVSEALELLRELPDLRLVRRLHLSDEPCYLDPWMRKIAGGDVRLLGHATSFALIALYRPDRRFRREIGLTLLHEWLHVVAFKHEIDLWRFGRANKIEQLTPVPFEGANTGRAKRLPHEAWSDFGEKLLGYDETIARETALTSPLHAMILWQRVEKILRRTPKRFRSTRFAELETRAAFVRTEVAAKAREIHTRLPP